jgi:hypothetical protein
MKKRSHFLILLILITGISPLCSQTVTGHWYGIGKVQVKNERFADARDSYLAELELHQNGKSVKGKLNYYFKDSLFINSIEGSYDAANRKLILYKTPIIFYGSTDIHNGVDCYVTGNFTLRTAKIESVLSGILLSDEAHRYVVSPIAFSFKKSADTASFVMTREPDDSEEMIPSAAPVLLTTPALAEAKKTPQQIVFEKREKVITQEITVKSSVISLELYDNGEIDYDSVTVFVNGKEILPESMLSHRAIRLTVQLDKHVEYTDISMFANNEGLIPPNTAALILYDGNKRYEIQMSSSLSRTATIRLRKEEPGKTE